MKILILFITIVGFLAVDIGQARAYTLTGYSGGGASSSGNYLTRSGGGSSYGRLNFSRGGYVSVSTSGSKVTPHRAAHQAYLAKKKQLSLARKNIPAPCGNYGRVPTYCKRGF